RAAPNNFVSSGSVRSRTTGRSAPQRCVRQLGVSQVLALADQHERASLARYPPKLANETALADAGPPRGRALRHLRRRRRGARGRRNATGIAPPRHHAERARLRWRDPRVSPAPRARTDPARPEGAPATANRGRRDTQLPRTAPALPTWRSPRVHPAAPPVVPV